MTQSSNSKLALRIALAVLSVVLVGGNTALLALTASLRCIGDTDGCEPSVYNTVVVVATAVVGASLTALAAAHALRSPSVWRTVAATLGAVVLLWLVLGLIDVVVPK